MRLPSHINPSTCASSVLVVLAAAGALFAIVRLMLHKLEAGARAEGP